MLIADDLWNSMIAKLRRKPADTNAIHALSRLNHCFMDKDCKPADLPRLAAAYDAALSHSKYNVGLLAVHGEYAWHVIKDRELTEKDYREVLRRHPHDIEAETNLIVVLIHSGKFDAAEAMIESMERRNYFGALDAYTIPLRDTLTARKKNEQAAMPTN